MRSKFNRRAAALTASALLLSVLMPADAVLAENEGNADLVITIESPEDFLAFAENCTLDSWSKGKTIVLNQDIDFGDMEFSPVPIFCGTFKGNGHKISGLEIDDGNSYKGLFRSVEEGGVIEGLTVSGTVSAEGAQEYVGGIAGSVRGTIRNCTFEGVIGGTMYVGGIAGINEKGGQIESCKTVGMIQGDKYTGGIAGKNQGSLVSCTNYARVNPFSGTEEKALDPELPSDAQGNVLERTEKTLESAKDHAEISQDIGGIAGYSTGTIKECHNAGNVGYAHVGYNVGGIAGRSTGYITGSSSEGSVWGRKDVGGITGQMAPDIQLIFSTDTLDRLDQELSVLSGLADSAMNHTDSSRTTISQRLDQISDYAETASGHTSDLADMTVDWADDNIQEVNKVMDMIGDTVDRLDEISGTGKGILDTIGDGVELLEDCIDEAGSALGTGAKGEEALRDMIQQLRDYNRQQKECLESMKSEGGDLIRCLASGDLEGALAAAENMKEAMELYKEAASASKELLKQFREEISSLPPIGKKLQNSAEDLGEAMDSLEYVSRDLADTADEIHKLFRDLSEREDVEFSTLGSDYKEKGDQVHDSISSIGDQLDLLQQEVGSSGDALSSDMRGLKDQLKVINDVLEDAADSARERDEKDVWSDVSEEEINNTTIGKTESCENTGSVEGDINVGGIAGSMAVERDLDPEDDIETVGSDSFNFHYETRAILVGCKNRGDITSKKDGAGGVVGRMDLGYILECENYGNVESQDGSYVGGIAGSSASTIRQSSSKCMLSGKNYIGGIAGDAYSLYDNLAFVSILDAEMNYGAVAGRVDQEGVVSGNRFVEGKAAGIDGVSYAQKAEPVAYEALIAEEGVPEEFGAFRLTYLADGAVTAAVTCAYGDKISDLDIPPVPEKQGYHGTWEPVGEETVTFDHRMDAVYTPYVTTIESSAMRDSVHPVILAEGNFNGDTVLLAEKLSSDDSVETWKISVSGIPEGAGNEYRYRFIPPADWENPSLSILTDSTEEKPEWLKDQSACVFTSDQTEFVLSVKKDAGILSKKVLYIGGGAGLAALLAAALFFRRFSKLK